MQISCAKVRPNLAIAVESTNRHYCLAVTAHFHDTHDNQVYILAHISSTEIYPDLTTCIRYAQNIICAIK